MRARSIGVGVAGLLVVAVVAAVAWYQGRERAGPVASRYRKPWHEMDLVLNKSGAWDVQLVIDDPRAQGKGSFRVDVSS